MIFEFCPSCGKRGIEWLADRFWRCPACGFEYFHNVATAAGVIIECRGAILMLRRAREPQKGMLALPGGFVDPGERAEVAALRECKEELGWAPTDISFHSSYPNTYVYKGVPYHTCDLYFYGRIDTVDAEDLCPDCYEIAEVQFMLPEFIPLEKLAFESARQAIIKLRADRGI